jgi:hypothetical protein
MLKTTTAIILLLLSAYASADALVEEGNSADDPKMGFCHSNEHNAEWGNLITKYPDDPAVVRLFALRHGLCELMEAGFIEKDFAISIFEETRQQEIERKLEEQRQAEQDKPA